MTGQSPTRRESHNESARSSDSSDLSNTKAQRSHSRGNAPGPRHQEPPASGRQFLFIDAGADRNTSSEAVRVHVMRESHRSRRERQGSQSVNRGRRAAAQDEMVILDLRNTSRPTSVTPPSVVAAEEKSGASISASTLDWPALVRAGISQFSLDSMQELYRMAEGYLRSVRLVQPDVLHLCRGDFLSMCAYLALAALQLASNEQEPANVASVQFEARALELLRLRITQSARMHADTTIIAVLLLSQLEHKDNAESALFHRNALKRLVQDRGGLITLREQNIELYGILTAGGFVEVVA